jgi:mannitol-1-phosphate 5-dehydrogenase
MMKKGVKLINMARGGLVNDDDLKDAINQGIVSRYVTDFPEKEIVGYDNVISIPHLGASTPESSDNCAIMAVNEIIDYLENGNIENSVNYPDCQLNRASDYRITLANRNIPNMVGQISTDLAEEDINILNMLNRSDGNYAYTIIDVDKEVISTLNDKGGYRVIEVGEERQEHHVDNVTGLPADNIETVSEEVAQADLITTAVGVDNLKFLIPGLSQGLQKKLAKDNPGYLNIIACENAVRASSTLKNKVIEELPETLKSKLEEHIGFPDSAVDRIVPPQAEDGLDVKVEPFSEWIIDKTQVKGPPLEINGAKLTDNLLAFVERKIFTLNTGHCGTAYLGYLKGYDYIHEAIADEEIYDLIKTALDESGSSLQAQYGFTEAEHEKYAAKILERFKNPALQDSVVRVGREPIRKLSPDDRLVKPAVRALEVNRFPVGLSQCIAAGFLFAPQEDEEGQQIQQMISRQGIAETVEEITGLNRDNMLGREVIRRYQKLKNLTRPQDKLPGGI